jgi:hypothetical protein
MGRLCRSGLCTGTRGSGQISLGNYDLITKLMKQAMPGDINMADPSYNKYSDWIALRKDKDSEGNMDFVAHGSKNSVDILVNGKVHTVDWRTVTKIIKSNKDYYPGRPIRILACNTGKTNDGFAQNLANKLNTTVYAPRTIIWANSDGSYYIADKEHSPKSEYQDFKKFTPRRKKK